MPSKQLLDIDVAYDHKATYMFCIFYGHITWLPTVAYFCLILKVNKVRIWAPWAHGNFDGRSQTLIMPMAPPPFRAAA